MYRAIAANKRNTLLIMVVFIVLISLVGWAFSAIYNDTTIAYIVLGIAIIYAFIQYFAAGALSVAATGAVEIEKKDNPRLYRVVENLAITLGIATPRVFIIDDPAPNAFATGRDPQHSIVAATTGLLDTMDDRELEAVMAHEMGHVQNYDIRVNMIVFGLVSAIGLLTDIAIRLFWFGGDRRSNNNNNPIVLVIGIVVIILAPILALLIQLAISRQREYLADASSALTTRDPEALASALEKLEKVGRPLRRQTSSVAHLFFSDPLKPGLVSRLFSTHPPLPDRIKRLRDNEARF